MKKIFAIAAGVIAVVILGILAYAATMPDYSVLARTASIKAPPEKIVPYLNDLRRAVEWSPWEKMDPAMERHYEGAAGVGQFYRWDSKSSGAGSQKIIESDLSHILIDLKFIRPFALDNIAEFKLVPKGEVTEVTWEMRGAAPYYMKVMSVFMDSEKMVGGAFEQGLADLKALAEK